MAVQAPHREESSQAILVSLKGKNRTEKGGKVLFYMPGGSTMPQANAASRIMAKRAGLIFSGLFLRRGGRGFEVVAM
jgi:hypothetical protein